MSAQILNFPAPDPDTFSDAWEARKGMMRKRGDGFEKTKKLWKKAAAKVGNAAMLAALKAYLNEKEPVYGFCGLSVWLNGERYDHWLPSEAAVAKVERPPYPQRPALIAALGEPFVVSYIDPATIHPDGWITPATEYAKNKLRERGRDLKAAGLVGIRAKE